MITDRRLAYANCAAEAGDLLRRKRPTCSARELAALRQRLWLLLWAKDVMCAYVLDDEECQGQWKPTDDDARCAMRLADPCCVQCGCDNPPNPAQTTPPSPPCNIVQNFKVRRAVDASEYTAGLANTKVYVVSNVQNVTNPWSPYVGYAVKGPLHHVVPTGWVAYAVVSASYWVQTPDGPGAYFPAAVALFTAGDVQISSPWPTTNEYLDRQVLIEVLVGSAWETAYSGSESELAGTITYTPSGTPTQIRTTYIIGTCTYGPYINAVAMPHYSHAVGHSHSTSFG